MTGRPKDTLEWKGQTRSLRLNTELHSHVLLLSTVASVSAIYAAVSATGD